MRCRDMCDNGSGLSATSQPAGRHAGRLCRYGSAAASPTRRTSVDERTPAGRCRPPRSCRASLAAGRQSAPAPAVASPPVRPPAMPAPPTRPRSVRAGPFGSGKGRWHGCRGCPAGESALIRRGRRTPRPGSSRPPASAGHSPRSAGSSPASRNLGSTHTRVRAMCLALSRRVLASSVTSSVTSPSPVGGAPPATCRGHLSRGPGPIAGPLPGSRVERTRRRTRRAIAAAAVEAHGRGPVAQGALPQPFQQKVHVRRRHAGRPRDRATHHPWHGEHGERELVLRPDRALRLSALFFAFFRYFLVVRRHADGALDVARLDRVQRVCPAELGGADPVERPLLDAEHRPENAHVVRCRQQVLLDVTFGPLGRLFLRRPDARFGGGLRLDRWLARLRFLRMSSARPPRPSKTVPSSLNFF